MGQVEKAIATLTDTELDQNIEANGKEYERIRQQCRGKYSKERNRQRDFLDALTTERANRRRKATRAKRWHKFAQLSTDELIALTKTKLSEQEQRAVLALLVERQDKVPDVITELRQRLKSPKPLPAPRQKRP